MTIGSLSALSRRHLRIGLTALTVAVAAGAAVGSALAVNVPPQSVDASYRDASIVWVEVTPQNVDASYRDASIVWVDVPPQRVDGSYREASRVIVEAPGGGIDWSTSGTIAVLAAIALVALGAVAVAVWVRHDHGQRRPPGAAVPSSR